jgi:hypothetical protein
MSASGRSLRRGTGRIGAPTTRISPMPLKSLLACLGCVFLSGCALCGPPVPLNSDTYALAAAPDGGPEQARTVAVEQASRWCRREGKESLVTDERSYTTGVRGSGYSGLTFRCVAPGEVAQALAADGLAADSRGR